MRNPLGTSLKCYRSFSSRTEKSWKDLLEVTLLQLELLSKDEAKLKLKAAEAQTLLTAWDQHAPSKSIDRLLIGGRLLERADKYSEALQQFSRLLNSPEAKDDPQLTDEEREARNTVRIDALARHAAVRVKAIRTRQYESD